MTVPGILRALEEASLYRDALSWARTDADLGLVDGLDAPALAGLLRKRADAGLPEALLAVVPTGRRAESLAQALAAYLPDAEVLTFPAWEMLPHERLSPSPDTVGQRLQTLRRVAGWSGGHPLIVVASVRAALQPIAGNLGEIAPLELSMGARGLELDHVVEQLVERAYSRVDMVSRRGEFAVRGGILDVFPPTSEHPYRVEFFGDEIDQIRAFSVADQRSLPGDVAGVDLPPSRELLLTQDVRDNARALKDAFPAISGMLEKMAEGIPVEGMESLLPAVAGPLKSLVEYMPEGSATAVVDPERASARAITLGDTNREFLDAGVERGDLRRLRAHRSRAGDFLTIAQLREVVRDRGGVWWPAQPVRRRPRRWATASRATSMRRSSPRSTATSTARSPSSTPGSPTAGASS